MATASTSTPSPASPTPTGAVGEPPLALADTDPTEGQDTPADDPSPLEPAAAEPTADPASDPTEGVGTALRAERRRANQLEKEIRTLRQQLNRFSEINPEEYARLQEAERQKQALELQIQQRERQMEEASAKKVAAVAAERDEARAQVLQLRKDRLLERAFSQAEGRTGGDKRGTFFDIFKGQLGECFRLATGKDGRDVLEPLDAQGKPLLGDDGRPLTTGEFLEELRVHPVYGFLFQQRGATAMAASGAVPPSGIGSNGEPINPQAMSAAELYRASFAINRR